MTTNNTTHAATIALNTEAKFKPWAEGKDGYKKLQELLAAGAITPDDITKIEKAGEPTKYQRKPFKMELKTLDVKAVLVDGALSAAQVDHLQQLVNKYIKDSNAKLVDNGNIEQSQFKSWEAILSEPFIQRSAAVKVTAEQIKVSIATMVHYFSEMRETPLKAAGLTLLTSLVEKRFTVASCNRIKVEVLEAMQGFLLEWHEVYLAADGVENVEDHKNVFNLVAGNLEKALAPEEELSLDIF